MPRVCKSAQQILNLRQQGKTDWYRILAKAGEPTQVHIYDEIGLFGVSASQFVADIAAIPGPLEIHLNTPGGEIFDGIAIYNALRQRAPKIVIDAIAASIGSVIAMAAAPGQLEIEPTASMMIHDGFAMAAGNASELRDLAQTLDEQSDIIAGIYASRTGKPQAEWRAAMRTETWYTADKALAAGLADRIRPQMTNLAHCPHCSSSATQTAFCAQCGSPLMAASNGGWKQENGNWIFDPDGDGDNDYTAAGDKDHDYWSADGKQLKSIPASPDGKQAAKPIDDDNTNPDGSKKPFPGAAPPFKPGGGNDFLISVLHDSATPHVPMIGEHDHGHPAYGSQGGDSSHGHSHKHGENGTPDAAHNHSHQAAAQASGASQFPFLDADVDNSTWDAGKAMAAGVKADDPAAFYKGICAGRRAGDPTTQAAWALPYKYTPSSPPNAAAVRNALARFSQTQGLTNAAEARKTLEAAMKVVNPDWEPSDEIDTELLAAAFSFAIEGGR